MMIRRGTLILVIVAATCAAAAAQDQSPVDRWLDLAAQRIEAGQPQQAAAAYRQVLRLDPSNDLAYRQLLRIDATMGVPDDPAHRDRLAAEFDEGVFLRQSDHYLLIYDGFHTWADTRVNMLEAAHERFIKTMRGAGFRALPPERRLEVVLFNKHESYERYAQDVDRMDEVWSAGHYSGRTNRIMLFNYHTSPQLANLLGEMQTAQNTADNRRTAAAERKLNQAKYRYEATASLANIKQTMHEAAHQLAFNTNIQRRDVQYPMWYSEGLATCFETTNPFAPFGPQQDNPLRRSSLAKAMGPGGPGLIPLNDFVAMADPPNDEQQRNAAYAQAWVLWHFAFDSARPALRTYTLNMLRAVPGSRSPQQFRHDFIRAFGPIEKVEPAFRDYVRSAFGGLKS